jgi:hypothetical protein
MTTASGLRGEANPVKNDAADANGFEVSEILRRRESVEERTANVANHGHQHRRELFLNRGVLQGTAVPRVHADIPGEPFDGRPGVVIADPDVVWPGRGCGGLIEQIAEIQVESLGRGAAGLCLDVLGDGEVPSWWRWNGAGAPTRFVASMTTLPGKPATLARASGTTSLGTASSTTSAPAAFPPSRPSWVTSCPAEAHSRPSVPPIVPLPIVVTFIEMALPFAVEQPRARSTPRRLVSACDIPPEVEIHSDDRQWRQPAATRRVKRCRLVVFAMGRSAAARTPPPAMACAGIRRPLAWRAPARCRHRLGSCVEVVGV